MRKKQLTSIMLGLIMTMLILPANVFAQDITTISVPDASVKAGETLELVMSVQNSPGVSGVGITVIYDEEALQLTNITSLMEGNFLSNIDRNNFSWLKGKNVTGDFDLVKLSFKISERASGTYTVKAQLTGNLAANITNQDAMPISVVFDSGTVSVEKKEGIGGNAGGTIGGGGGTVGGGDSAGENADEILPEEPTESFFEDVSSDAYYYDAVLWAVTNGVSSGTSGITFSPDETCTRAQTVTFLWNAAGKPEPKSIDCPFNDVASTAYYYKAVLWAVEEGITSGTSATTFSPNATVTRGQNVTFLWKFADKPAVEDDFKFVDVTEANYYRDAVVWAAEEGITSGTSANTFSPENPCTRAQIVTFLYRHMAK